MEITQSKRFLEEDLATSQTLASFQRVYGGLADCWPSDTVVCTFFPACQAPQPLHPSRRGSSSGCDGGGKFSATASGDGGGGGTGATS